jgi:hypothetical protein
MGDDSELEFVDDGGDWLPEAMSKGDWRVARSSALRDVVYDEFLQRKDVRLLVRGGARGRGREGGMRGGDGVAPPRRYRWISAAEIINSGEEFLFDGGDSGSGSRGEGRGRQGA